MRRRTWWPWLVAVGAVVGVISWATSRASGAVLCSQGDAGLRCLRLIDTLSLRVGLVAGFATVLMLLLIGGLFRMLSQDEARRDVIAREEAESSRDRGWPDD